MRMHGALVCGGVLPLVFACSSGVVEVDSGSGSASAPTSASAGETAGTSGSATGGDSETDGTESSGISGTSGTSGTDESGSSPGVDLALTSIELAPGSPRVGDEVWISASIKNHGADDLELPVRLGFAIDGVPRAELAREILSLGAGQEVEMAAALPWTPEESGVVEVAAVVDADAMIDEADEADNFMAVEVTVGGGAAQLCRTIDSWAESAPVVDGERGSHPLPSLAHDGWFYVHTQRGDGGDRILYAAKPDADGVLGPWQVASSDHGGGPHGFTAVDVAGDVLHFRNGHIARYKLSEGVMDGDVELLEDDVETAFGGRKYVWDSAVYVEISETQRFLIHLGGFSFAGYTYRPDVFRSAVPVEPAFAETGLEHPSSRPGKAAVFAPEGAGLAYLYTGAGGGDGLWRGTVDGAGEISGWDSLGDLPQGTDNGRGDLFIAGRSLFVIRGAAVFRSNLGDEGALSEWVPQASLPTPQIDVSWGDGHTEGAAYGLIGDHVHVMGPKRVYTARLGASACDR